MTRQSQHQSQHPVLGCAGEVLAAIKSVRDVQPVFMSPADQQAAVIELGRAATALAELQLRVLAASGEAADQAGARDVGAWAAHLTHADFAPSRADARLASALDRSWQQVAAGMADGTVSVAHARVVVHALEALPDDLDPNIVAKAEGHLVELCHQFTPTEVRRLGRRILEVVAPDIVDAEEAKALEKEEQRARETCRLTLKPIGDGSTRLSGVLPDADATRLRTYLEAYTSPRKDDHTVLGEEDRIPYRRKLGHAFCALLEHLNPAKLPQHGGDTTTVMVTIGLDALRHDLGTGAILGGEPLSATAIRRLACEANIIPVVLGGKGEILDLGRSRRLFSPAQRKAMRLRDQHCRAEGCSVPARWCEAHHWIPWSKGGKTDLDDGVLGCSFHHHLLHDPRYTHEILPNGDIRFHRRT